MLTRSDSDSRISSDDEINYESGDELYNRVVTGELGLYIEFLCNLGHENPISILKLMRNFQIHDNRCYSWMLIQNSS